MPYRPPRAPGTSPAAPPIAPTTVHATSKDGLQAPVAPPIRSVCGCRRSRHPVTVTDVVPNIGRIGQWRQREKQERQPNRSLHSRPSSLIATHAQSQEQPYAQHCSQDESDPKTFDSHPRSATFQELRSDHLKLSYDLLIPSLCLVTSLGRSTTDTDGRCDNGQLNVQTPTPIACQPQYYKHNCETSQPADRVTFLHTPPVHPALS